MTIGFFDSGLGGLLLMESCTRKFPQHNYVYLGDTKNLPYGPKTTQEIYHSMAPCIDYLFEHENCDHVIVACNTASVEAVTLYIDKHPQYKEKCHSIVEPTLKHLKEANHPQALCMATLRTTNSEVYKPYCSYSIAMPGLVSLIEENALNEALVACDDVLQSYPDTQHVFLGCTHYLWLKDQLEKRHRDINFFGQDSIIENYVRALEEASVDAESEGSRSYLTTQSPENYEAKYGHKFVLCDIT